MQSDLFFIISSVGFVILALLATVVLVYLILILRRWYRISTRLDRETETLAVQVREAVALVAEHRLFAWLFGKKKSKRRTPRSSS